MALCAEAGYAIQTEPEGCDVVVVNTCGFLASACGEAIENILEMAELKKEGKIKKILVTGCMTQRYKGDIFNELPEVDGLLGTGSYGDIVSAVAEVMEKGTKPCHLGNIHTANQSGERILSTPPWYAYLRIAEGCDNHCAYCVIPSLRGKYRSRPMDELLDEAAELASAGVKELIVIAQDITRYGTDLNGEHQLARLLRELCKLDFHWIRLHYLYPTDTTDELIDVIAGEPKIVKYLDIPIQHCNDTILKAMNEGDTAFEELCDFLREVKIERAGVFTFSPEEGTKAALMDHVDTEEARRRAELVVDVQSDIIDAYNESVLGTEREVLCEGFDSQAQMHFGRSYAESPDIDGRIWFEVDRDVEPGTFVTVLADGKRVRRRRAGDSGVFVLLEHSGAV